MLRVLTCLGGEHDLRLVAVGVLICAVASCTAFGYLLRALRSNGVFRWTWLGVAALVAGSGIWAMHFIAMLAYQPSLDVRYEPVGAAASLGIAVTGMALGFAVPAWFRGRLAVALGGAVAGASVTLMHYTGLAAMRLQAHLIWDRAYVAASVAIALVGGVAAFFALHVSLRRAGPRPWLAPAAILLVAIAAMHFTSMTAVTLLPDAGLTLPSVLFDRFELMILTSGLACLILMAGAGLMAAEWLGRQNNLIGMRHAMNAVPAALAFFGPDDRLRLWNGNFSRLVARCGLQVTSGLTRHEVLAPALRAGWFGEPDRSNPRWALDLERRIRDGEVDWPLPDGSWIRVEVRSTQDGGSVTVVNDTTQDMANAAAMVAARDAAEAANRAKSEFLANISHEIRTPLNGVLAIAEVLNRTDLSQDQRRLVGVILRSGGLLNGLLTDLLDVAQVEAGALELRPEPTPLGDLVRSVCELFGAHAQEKGLILRADVADDAEGVVDCDPRRLSQVLGNLVSNALKFTDRGSVVIGVVRQGARVRFDVRDTGAGFDPAQKAVLFQRFRQADSSATRRHGGAGLGLAICSDYLRLMGGAIDCDSTPSVGSVFHFELDLPAREPIAPEAQPLADETPADAGRAASYRALIVDDNAVNREVMELILDSVGIEHVSVENGLEAVRAAEKEDFAVVLMDLQMPVMDGFEATRRIRAMEASGGRARAQIVVVSANCLDEHIAAAGCAGADDHISKPISAAALITAIAGPAQTCVAA